MPTGIPITIGHCHVTPLVRVSMRIRGICQPGESWKGVAQSVPIRNPSERSAPEDFGPRPKSDDRDPGRAARLERSGRMVAQTIPSWNQIHQWLQELSMLKEALWWFRVSPVSSGSLGRNIAFVETNAAGRKNASVSDCSLCSRGIDSPHRPSFCRKRYWGRALACRHGNLFGGCCVHHALATAHRRIK